MDYPRCKVIIVRILLHFEFIVSVALQTIKHSMSFLPHSNVISKTCVMLILIRIYIDIMFLCIIIFRVLCI